MPAHRPVLRDEALAQLQVRAAGVYVDGTYGRGGHARAILEHLESGGRLVAMDLDPQAVEAAQQEFGGEPRVTIVRGSFAMLERTIEQLGLAGQVDGILADLGVSSPQFDDSRRGFSFSSDGPLDMRMDPDHGPSAADWINNAPESEISRVLKEYGEERFHRRIAGAIVRRRAERPFSRTAELAECIVASVPARERNKHPATRCFQAIRIHVNGELDALHAFLPQCPRVLKPGGRLCVIAFHSLEDRIVKRFLRGPVETGEGPRGLPRPDIRPGAMRPVGKPIRPGTAETEANPRARSAVLRTGERVA